MPGFFINLLSLSKLFKNSVMNVSYSSSNKVQ